MELLRWDQPIGCFVDCTLGGGGHFQALLEASAPVQKIYAFDQDGETLERTKAQLNVKTGVEFIHANFSQIQHYVKEPIDRLIADLGVSSFQLDQAERGFSFRSEGPLDMRMNTAEGKPISEALATIREADLAQILFEYGEERRSRPLSRQFIQNRKSRELKTTNDLVECFGFRMESRDHRGKHPLTKVFQALRVWWNQELEALDELLAALPDLMAPGGRVGIISFHSLEDRRVKQALKGSLKPVNKKVIQAEDSERYTNPRARSAKLRVFEKS